MAVKAIVNLGCGHMIYPEATNLDSVALQGVDVVHDLEQLPWPFEDQSQDEVWAESIFEHVTDPIAFMRESWRILKPGGLLHLVVPHWQSENAWTDPTHKRFPTERTFDYWCEGTALFNQFGDQYAAGCVYVKESVARQGEDIVAHLRRRR